MRLGDTQIGFPSRPYTNTKANIEALTGVPEGAVAYATDVDMLGKYSGAAWVWDTTRGRAPLPFGVYTNISPLTGDSYPYSATIVRNMTLQSWAQGLFVSTTNSGAHYWYVRLVARVGGTTLKTLNTSAISPNVPTTLSTTSFDVAAVATSVVDVYIYCFKSGSPGDLYIFGPAVEVTYD